MIAEISGLLNMLHILAGFGFLSAVIYSFKLYRETDKGWYWLSLVLSAFFFALAQWTTIIFPVSIENFEIISLVQESSEVIAGALFTISCFGIYKTMKQIRKRLE
jgi:hypothetical protein